MEVVSADGFRTLYDRHSPAVYRYLAHRVGPTTAEDLLATVFTTAWTSRDRLAEVPSDREIAWLLAVSRHAVQHHHRDQQRHHRRVAAARPEVPGASVDEGVVERMAAAEAVRSIVPTLSDDEQRLVESYVLGDGSYERVAQDLALPVGTVKSRMSRLRTRLRRSRGGGSDAR
ncbi:MAG TPA: sigma-70 family RNA polymerase sigma factor [Acidimicrobiales bacterium]|nr:sigma-70 family RNA polymerase sigma factor [Acidimicrobiales bacterium]